MTSQKPSVHVDALIIGGGPAGSCAANLLKQSNPDRHILVAEKAKFPRHHIGESTLPDSNGILAKLGVLEDIENAGFLPKVGATFRWSESSPPVKERFSHGHSEPWVDKDGAKVPTYAWQIQRSVYDAILLNGAERNGVDVRQLTAVTDLDFDTKTATLRGPVRSYTLSYGTLIDASGQARILGRTVGNPVQRHNLGNVALFRYYEDFNWSESMVGKANAANIFFSVCPAGWMWFIAQSPQRCSVGLVTRKEFVQGRDIDELVDEMIESIPEIRDALNGARQTGHELEPDQAGTRTIQDWTYKAHELCGDGWFVCGDAAAFVDPVLSSGVNMALHSGMMVANAINTTWNYPDVPVSDVQAGYTEFFSGLFTAFTSMAEWWYGKRECVSDWYRQARLAAGTEFATVDISDQELFRQFIAGYLTDYRFRNIGTGFGPAGFAQIDPQFFNENDAFVIPDIAEYLDKHLATSIDAIEVEHYCATHVETDRWWKLPRFRMTIDGKEQLICPPVLEADDGSMQAEISQQTFETVLKLADSDLTVLELGRQVCRELGLERNREHVGFIFRQISHLMAVGALRPRHEAASKA